MALIEEAEIGEAVPWDMPVDCTDDELAAHIVLMAQGIWEPTNEDRPQIPTTIKWWVDENIFIGRISLRHSLNGEFGESHGHIGYGIRPTMRRRGHATAMLRDMLQIAAEAGLATVLITCDPDNPGSRNAIESNGGVLRDFYKNEVLRFDVATNHVSVT